MSPPWDETVHWEGTEIPANIIEKCDEETRQKQLLLTNRASQKTATNTDKPPSPT
jgi:hypothetical protein